MRIPVTIVTQRDTQCVREPANRRHPHGPLVLRHPTHHPGAHIAHHRCHAVSGKLAHLESVRLESSDYLGVRRGLGDDDAFLRRLNRGVYLVLPFEKQRQSGTEKIEYPTRPPGFR